MNSTVRKELFSKVPVASVDGLGSFESSASKVPTTVKVSPKNVLNAVLATMGLSETRYKTYACPRGLVGATVYYWVSSEPTKNHGKPAATTDEAMENAATSCLEHLARNMEIELACPQVQKLKDEIIRLSGNINDMGSTIRSLKTKIEKKDLQVRRLSKGWGSFADDICASGHRIGKVAESYLPAGPSPLVTDVSWDFYGLSQEADNLKETSLVVTDAIQTIGIYPYDAESDH